MNWFKHYANASDSQKITELIEQMGLEGYAQYFLLLELLCAEFDGKNTKIRIHENTLKSKLRLKFSKKLAKVAQKFADFQLTSFQKSGNFWIFDAPILLELQSKHFRYGRSKRPASENHATLRYKDNKNKDITLPNGRVSEAEKISNSDPSGPVMKKAATKHHWLADVWNENRGSLPACRTPLSSRRASSVKLRCKEEPDPQVWAEVVRRLAASDFCNGKNDRRWVADFSFLIKPNTREVTLEGRYDNRSAAGAGVRSISSILEDHANV